MSSSGSKPARADQPAIGDYAIVGDGRSAALISRDGSVDWLCWPRFDSASVFGALLDPDGGHFRIAPPAPFRVERAYVDETNVLVTRFTGPGGRVALTDLMPALSEEEKRRRRLSEHQLLRVATCERGEVELEVTFAPRPEYGRRPVGLRRVGGLGLRFEVGRKLFTLHTPCPLSAQGAEARGRVRLRQGESLAFSLDYHEEAPASFPCIPEEAAELVESSIAWWRRWSSQLQYQGRYRSQVLRSALALKLMSYAPSGAIVAAPTTSLPERVGGPLNWDYRFCWMRDAALTVRALDHLGFRAEVRAFVGWLEHSTRLTLPELQVLYDVYGEVPRSEEELSHWRGYRGSQPVRIRNAAVRQLQLDSYGELIDAGWRISRNGLKLDHDTRKALRAFGEYVCRRWQLPDHGIWEPRGPPQEYTHSRVLCWVALDRILDLHDRGLIGRIPRDRFALNRDLIRLDVQARGWNPYLQSYTQTLDGDSVDASLLLLGWYGFEAPSSYRMRATLQRIRERLEVRDGLLYRYEQSRTDGEGAFGACSFWAVEALARGGGSLADARASYERLLSYANDVGLFSEQIDPASGAALGNFPQAFTHIGVITAALALEERAERARGLRRLRRRPSVEVQP